MHPEFELSPDLIHLNHAAIGPWPRRTRLAVEDFAHDNAIWGSLHYPQWLQIETRLREQLARLIGAVSIDDIALLKNTSEALSVVAHGLSWEAGDEIVISDQEFPSNRIVWESLARYGVKVVAVALQTEASPEQALQKACSTRTRLLSISSVQYASGLRLDLAGLGRFCQQQKILFCVDAIQSLGALQMDVEAIDADFVMADGHKWMLGPEGVALFYSRPSAREQLQLHQYGWHMVEHHQDFDHKDWEIAHTARRFECGSPNMLGIHALQASLGLLLETGLANIEQQVLDRSQQLMQWITESKNLECLTDSQPGRYGGIVTLRHRQVAGECLYRYLMGKQVLCALRGGGVRFSPHFYTPLSQLERAVRLADDCPLPE